jgi:hypothetical protein
VNPSLSLPWFLFGIPAAEYSSPSSSRIDALVPDDDVSRLRSGFTCHLDPDFLDDLATGFTRMHMKAWKVIRF